MRSFLQYLLAFVLLVALQEFVFDNINFGVLTSPYIYIMFIIMLPLATEGWLLLVLGFATGLVMDLLAGTPGLHAMVATWLAFVRPATANFMLGKEIVSDGGLPVAGRVGTWRFIRYVAVMTLLFNVPFFLLEDPNGAFWVILMRIIFSTVLVTAVIYFLHLPFNHTKATYRKA